MNANAPTPETAELTAELANITKALAYADDPFDKVRLTRIAKTFLARHEKELGCEEWVIHAKAKAFDFEREDHKIPLYGPAA